MVFNSRFQSKTRRPQQRFSHTHKRQRNMDGLDAAARAFASARTYHSARDLRDAVRMAARNGGGRPKKLQQVWNRAAAAAGDDDAHEMELEATALTTGTDDD